MTFARIKGWIPLHLRVFLRSALRLVRHDLSAAFGRGAGVLLLLWPTRGGWRVRDPVENLSIPAFRRWELYRNGIRARCTSLARLYGIDDLAKLEPGDVVVDVGANVGELSRAALALGASVVAVEADPEIYRLLRRNLAGRPDCRCVHAAAWCRDEEMTLYHSRQGADSSLIEPSTYTDTGTVSARRLDSLLPELGIDRVKFLKCDAEGAEPEVLAGAEDTLSRTEWVAFDCGPERRGLSTYAECAEFLSRRGFEVMATAGGRRAILIARRSPGSTIGATPTR